MVNLFSLNTKELQALVIYKDVIEKENKFTKDFWTDEKHQVNGIRAKSRILTRYCLENLAHIEVTSLPKYNLKQIKSILIKQRLFGMVQIIFSHDILAILKNAYPEEFSVRILKEWMWGKHGIWNDNRMVIEAVQDMVFKEGIRQIENIATLDWKKRLIKYGIYNILVRFDWSIYALFSFVYPSRFHPADFKYKAKWAATESLENAFYFMHKTFKKEKFLVNDILLLSTSDFRKIGLSGMLMTLFDSSTLKAKEYYLYKTVNNKEHQKEISQKINTLIKKKKNRAVIKKLHEAAIGKYIYNLHSNTTLYSYIKRHAKENNMTIDEFITSFGFIYKSTKKDIVKISHEDVWNLRKQGLTYVQIAHTLGSNPTTINAFCNKHFGGDPLIPRPIEDYITVQELMDKYHIDHKTVMKLVHENKFENHTTIRFRYLRKSEIEPAILKYIEENKQHQHMIKRYAN